MDTKPQARYLRNFVFGVEDSLVSTVGMLSGIAAAGTPSRTILIAGCVLLFVEAFSMGVGSTLSENSVEEFVSKTEVPLAKSARDGVVMFFSYILAGIIPLFPYVFFETYAALSLSIALSLLSLFGLGAISGKISKTNPAQQGARMLVLGGLAVILGIGVGALLNNWMAANGETARI